MKKYSKKILIGGNGGCKNLGDDAILITLVNRLKECLSGVSIAVLAGEPDRFEEILGVRVVNLQRRFALKELYGSDIFICGGGTLFAEEVYSNRQWWLGRGNPFYSLSLILLAKILGKKVIIFGVGVGPLRSFTAKILTPFLFNKVDLITVRDLASKLLLEKLGVKKNFIHVTGDPAFLLELPNKISSEEIFLDKDSSNRNNYVVGLVVANENIPRLSEFKYELAEAGDYLIQEHKAKVVFIPMNLKFSQDPQGIQDIKNLMRHGDKASVISGDLGPIETLEIISKLDFIISMRLHALIFAIVGNTPIIGLERSSKIKNLFDFLNLEYVVHERELGSRKLIYFIDEVLKQHSTIKSILKSKLNLLREQALLNFILLEREISRKDL